MLIVAPRSDGSVTCALDDETPIVLRPLCGDDAHKLAAGLRELSTESRYCRFLTRKISLSRSELNYFTHCDSVNHLALGAFLTDPAGGELELVGVARCVRDTNGFAFAEVAIVVADAWQKRSIGKLLFAELAQRAWRVGVRHWKAVFFASNIAIRRLLESIGEKQAECAFVPGVVAALYRLTPADRLAEFAKVAR